MLDAAATIGNGNGALKSTHPIDLEGAESLVVNVSHPGYTSYSRKVTATEVIYLNAELQIVEPVTVSLTQTTSVSGAVTDGFTLAVPATGVEGDILVAIPRSLLPEGTTSLSAELKAFDPNDPQDVRFFPGDYADSDGNNLVSVAFNYADIRTNTGQDLTTLAKNREALRQSKSALAAQAAEMTEPVIINRSIPSGSCGTLARLGDANSESIGFQIPVYSYDNSRGIWELLGYGTVFTSTGQTIASVDGDDCESGDYVLEIAVTSEIFLSKWWNLDYPLVFSQPVSYCAKVRLQNEEEQPLNGLYGFLYGEAAGFSSQYFVTDEQGEAELEVQAADAGDTLTANITVFGEADYSAEVILARDCDNPQTQNLVAQLPKLCQVNGRVEYVDGKPATKHPVLAVPTTFAAGYYFDFTASNAAGDYWLNVTCENDYTISVYSYTNEETIDSINVNGVTEAMETTDDGNLVTLPTLNVIPIPTSIYWAAYSTVEKRIVLAVLGHRDYFPISYNLKVKNASGQQLGVLEGVSQLSQEFNEEDLPFWYFGFSLIDLPLDLNTGGATTLHITGVLTDARDESMEVDTVLLVTEGAPDLDAAANIEE